MKPECEMMFSVLDDYLVTLDARRHELNKFPIEENVYKHTCMVEVVNQLKELVTLSDHTYGQNSAEPNDIFFDYFLDLEYRIQNSKGKAKKLFLEYLASANYIYDRVFCG